MWEIDGDEDRVVMGCKVRWRKGGKQIDRAMVVGRGRGYYIGVGCEIRIIKKRREGWHIHGSKGQQKPPLNEVTPTII